MKQRWSFPGVATVDLLIGLLLAEAFMFCLSVLAMNMETDKSQKRLSNAASFLIRVQWDGKSEDDVDCYTSDPLHHLVFFKRLCDGLMVLDRDDTGAGSNRVTLPDGRIVKSEFNEETVEIRGEPIPGEYIVNCQMFSKRSPEPTKVAVSLYKRTSNDDIKVYDVSITLDHRAQEETAFRFTLSRDGDVSDINRLPKRFVGNTG